MEANANAVTRPNSKYPWVICLACLLVFFTSIGMTPGTFSVHAPFMMEEWGMSNTQNSTIVSIRTFVGLITIWLCGPYYGRLFTHRVGMTIGVALGAVGFGIFALAHSFAMGCIAAIFTGACYGFAGSIPVSVIVANWFNKQRALAMGICFAASGLAAFVVPPIATRLITTHSLSFAFVCEGCFVLLMALIAFLLLRNKPEDIGAEPWGGKDAVVDEGNKNIETCYKENRQSSILLLIVSFLIGIINYVAYNHFSVLYSSSGWDPEHVALFMSMAGFTLLVGKPLCGLLADLITAKRSAIIFFGLTFIAMIMATFASAPSPGLHVAQMLVYGLGGVLATIGISAYALELSDKENYAKNVRWNYVVYGLSGVITAPIVGMIADATGSYVPAYWGFAALTIVAYIILMIAYNKANKIYKEELNDSEANENSADIAA